jgi:hypothetical protein
VYSIRKGKILIYRVFDVAEEIDLRHVEQLLTVDTKPQRLKLSGGTRYNVVMRNAPIALSMGETEMILDGEVLKVETNGKIWDYGVISISFHIQLPENTSWDDLIKRAAQIEAYTQLDEIARARSRELASFLKPAFNSPGEWSAYEDYVIYYLEDVGGISKPAELLQYPGLASLILAETTADLASSSLDGLRDSSFQYRNNDLTVIDWNSALVVDPMGQQDVVDMIEFALTHLLEMRYYDDLLDNRLNQLYDNMEARQGFKIRSRFSEIHHDVSSRYIEFTEFFERVENSLKVVGDSYLATIFRAASRRFRLKDWEENVTRKLNILAQVSELLQGEIDVRRSQFLEIIIILLIAVELVSAYLRLH